MDAKKTYICSVCVDNEKKKGLMCPACYERHKDYVKQALHEHEQVETQTEYALRRTKENLTLLKEELTSLMKQTRPYFNTAHEEIHSECRGVRLEKEDFMDCVKKRLQEILKKAGLERTDERIEWLKKTIRVLEDETEWLRKINIQKEVTDRVETEKVMA